MPEIMLRNKFVLSKNLFAVFTSLINSLTYYSFSIDLLMLYKDRCICINHGTDGDVFVHQITRTIASSLDSYQVTYVLYLIN